MTEPSPIEGAFGALHGLENILTAGGPAHTHGIAVEYDEDEDEWREIADAIDRADIEKDEL